MRYRDNKWRTQNQCALQYNIRNTLILQLSTLTMRLGNNHFFEDQCIVPPSYLNSFQCFFHETCATAILEHFSTDLPIWFFNSFSFQLNFAFEEMVPRTASCLYIDSQVEYYKHAMAKQQVFYYQLSINTHIKSNIGFIKVLQGRNELIVYRPTKSDLRKKIRPGAELQLDQFGTFFRNLKICRYYSLLHGY